MKRRKRQKRKRWEQLVFPSLLLVPSREVETAQENPAPSIAKSAGHTLAWVTRMADRSRHHAWIARKPDREKLAAIAGATQAIGLLLFQCLGCVPETPRTPPKNSAKPLPGPDWVSIEDAAKSRGKLVQFGWVREHYKGVKEHHSEFGWRPNKTVARVLREVAR